MRARPGGLAHGIARVAEEAEKVGAGARALHVLNRGHDQHGRSAVFHVLRRKRASSCLVSIMLARPPFLRSCPTRK